MSDPKNLELAERHDRLRPAEFFLLLVSFVLLTAFTTIDGSVRYPDPPDFKRMAVGEKKRQFFAYLSPIISEVNFQFAADRDRVRELRAAVANGERLSWSNRRWLKRLALELEVELTEPLSDEALAVLQRRAGIVPESIVLIQAAVESGWGTSRFALEGNNYFGQRCYSSNCGMTPEDRPEGERFGLAEFATAAESVESYIFNLNTHEGYREFRDLRQQRRRAGDPITGLSLVDALENYSERGDEYVDQIRSMIRSNNLE